MNKYTVKIEKLINEGKSLAKIDNMPVFIERGCPDELVEIEIEKINKSYLVGKIVEIKEPSKHRVKAKCPYFNNCGSCDFQHISYDEQLRQKTQIVKETLAKISNLELNVNDIIPSPKQFEYRCKVQLPVAQNKKTKRILSGYYKKNSHELINIKYCPLQNDIINEITEFIKDEAQKLDISGYDEKSHIGYLKHIIFRISSDLSQILIIFVINSDKITQNLKLLSTKLQEKYSQIIGICANFNDKKTNIIMSFKTENILGKSYYIENLSNKKYRISANSFFQVNPYCAELIFDKVKEIIKAKLEKPTILDAYSGVSSFGIWLADIANKVICVEEVKSASLDAIENIKLNNLKNVEIINGDATKEFEKLKQNNVKFDVSIVDPPRKGCDINAIENLVELTSKFIVYVSCNPSTLARDMKILNSKCFKPTLIQPFDMFPNTAHIETLVLFEKKKEA
jgi:23S rRNA (uracil1939-C5)-methyltransferase